MKSAHGLRRYFYEYIFHQAIDHAREQTREIMPISQARAIRSRVDGILAGLPAIPEAEGLPATTQRLTHPKLGIRDCLSAIDQALGESVRNYDPQFGDHSADDERYRALQKEFSRFTGVGGETNPKSARLPISPYDPEWAERATIKRGGTALSYLPDKAVATMTGGEVDRVAAPQHGNAMLWRIDDDGKAVEAGRAMIYDDASGLTALMDKMSEAEYNQVRGWVLDGGRDPRTGRIDRNRFMSQAAVARSVAVLDELKSQGTTYEVIRDINPGQIKAVLADTGLEIRLTEPRESEDFAGARIYDNGLVSRYSTNHWVNGGVALHSASPEEAVALLRFAQGRPVERRDVPGAVAGVLGTTHTESSRSGPVEVPDAYHTDKESMFVVGDYTPSSGSKVLLRRENASRTLPTFFVDAEAAEAYGRVAVESARANLQSALDVEGIIDSFHAQRSEGLNLVEFEPPDYSADAEVAAIQRSYWDVLTGERTSLLRPGATEEMYAERLEAIGESADAGLGNLVYGGSPEEIIRDHAADVPFELIGTWEAETHQIDGEWVDQRFEPGRVAKYMTSSAGQWSNLDDLAAALRRAEISPHEMMGSGFQTTRFKDRLVRFDAETAVPIVDHPSEFIQRVGATVHDSLARSGTAPGEILIDDKGVISYTAEKQRRGGARVPVSGQIGQVFDVGDHGEIVTRFASGENALIVPGYQARIRAQTPGHRPTSVEKRTMLRGYEQLVHERIAHQIAGDLVATRSEVGEPASLNGVYPQLYGTKHPVDFIERATELSIDRETGEVISSVDPWVETILSTEARRVRYSNEVKTGSTIYAEYRAGRDRTDPADDNRFDAWRLTGGRNMTVLTGIDANRVPAPVGCFDPVMTGGATNQGIVRYLTEDATVLSDGTIEPGDPDTVTGTRAPLMTRPELETLRYDPFDRQQMTASTIMQSSKVTESPVGTAMMTFGGWTADDPIVVSSEFAETHQIRGTEGQLRHLVVGDKLSDLHGNKGVISLVVDRSMSIEDAEAQGIAEEVAWFRENPRMDVVMSPFSLISRRNAGSARELMSGDVGDLIQPHASMDPSSPDEGAHIQGARGEMRFVVTHMAVDEKSKIYDDEAVQAGRGRKASSQLAWALGSKDCPAIMREFYGHNTGPESNVREYLRVTGLDMDADGTLRVVGQAEPGEESPARRFIPMPALIRTKPGRSTRTPGLNTTAMRKSFGDLIGDRGGDLELPFALTFPTGEQTEQASATSWKLPVLSSHLRSGQEFDDGTSVMHDYTRSYQEVFVESCRYRFMQEKLASERLTDDKRSKLLADMSTTVQRAQRSFEAITNDVTSRVLTGKNNIFKTGLMASRLSDSATLVWTADPRLDIDQVALSPEKAARLGLEEGDHALVWRDPVLRDSGVRYMRVALDERLTGVAINPVMDKCFDGDFDGDAVAVVKLHSQAANDEAMAKFSVPANLLDTGMADERGTHPFAMQVSLDTQVAISKNPLVHRGRLVRLSGEANLNAIEPSYDDPEMNESVAQRNRDGNVDLTRQLSDFYRYTQRDEFGSALRFDSPETHLQSIRDVCVKTGAKGNERKLADYARNLGDEQGEPGIARADQEASMFATAIKAHGTGLGGSYSQRAVRALRSEDLKAVLEVTYPVTQSILQAKHDAAEARHKYEMLQGPGRDLWRGRKLEHVGVGQWKPEFAEGEPVQATTEEWAEQFQAFYEAGDGFNVRVNPEYVQRVAKALTDPNTGLVRNLEEDKSLQGTVMDRMAYGGEFSTLVAAAAARENVYDGPGNEQFAPAPTARVRTRSSEAEVDVEVPMVETAVLKRDALADGVGQARTRLANRRSAQALVVDGRPEYTPSIEIEQPAASGHDEGMGF